MQSESFETSVVAIKYLESFLEQLHTVWQESHLGVCFLAQHHILSGVLDTEPKAFQVVYGNPAMAQMLGCAPQELAQSQLRSFLDDMLEQPDDRDGFFHALSSKSHWHGYLRLVRKSGVPLWGKVNLMPNYVPGGGEVLGYLCLCEDATDHKQQLEILRNQVVLLQEELEAFAAERSDLPEQQVWPTQKSVAPAEKSLPSFLHTDMDLIGMLTGDAQGAILDANDRFLEMMGYTREELKAGQLNWIEMTPEEYRWQDEEGARRFIETGIFLPCEKQFIHKQGHRVDVLIGITHSDPGRAACFVIDITQTKREHVSLQKKARDLETHFSATFHQAAVGIVHTSMDGRWIRANQRMAEITGYSIEELLGLKFQNITHPDDVPGNITSMQRLLKNEVQHYRTEKRYIRKDGSLIWVNLTVSLVRDEQDNPLYFIAMVEDITRRKQVEKALKESETKYRQMIETATEGVWMLDADDRTVFVNRQLAEMLGYTPEEMHLMPVLNFVETEATSVVLEHLMLRRQGVSEQYDVKLRHKDGQTVWALVSGAPMFDEANGAYLGCLGMLMDITERKQTEQTLRESEELFRLIQQATHDAIWDWDMISDHLVWNENLQCHFGYRADEIEFTLHWWSERIHPEDRERVFASMQKAIYGGGRYWSDEYRFLYGPLKQSSGGEQYSTVLDRGYVVHNDRGQPIRMIGSLLDITERKRVEKALEESEERFRLMANSSPSIIWTSDQSGQCDFFSKAGLEFTGCSPEEALENRWTTNVHPEDQALAAQTYQTAFSQRQAFELEYRLKHHSGEYRWVLDKGTPCYADNGEFMGFIGSCLEIHDRKITEVVLEESERFVVSVFNSLDAQVAIIDEEGCIIAANEGLKHCVRDYLGVDLDKVIGVNYLTHCISNIYDKELALKTATGIRDVIDGLEPRFAVEIPVKKDERTCWYYLQATRFAGEGPTRVVLHHEDISQRVAAERQLKRLAQQLMQSNRELQNFATIASHDLQEPLRKVMTFSGRVKANCKDKIDTADYNYLERMEASAHRMQDLVNGLLEFSRLTTRPMSFTLLDLNQVIQEVLGDLEMSIEETGAEITVSPLPVVEADRTQMRQLFQNLVSNALKFRKPDQAPVIHIQSTVVEHLAKDPQVPMEYHDKIQEPCYQITVQDNGIGFNVRQTEKIFSPFQRLHGVHQYYGTGMGLAICRKIVERHGGAIYAESQQNQGSLFTVLVPVQQGE